MTKKLGLLLAAMADLAFAVPAFASAATGLTEGGALVPKGTELQLTNVGEVTFIAMKTGNIACRNMTFTEEVTPNTLAIAASSETGVSLSQCSRGGVNVVFKSGPTLTPLHTTGGDSGSASVSLAAELIPGGLTSEAPLSVAPLICGVDG